ncbi:MAG: NADH-quinone oxidoreductase subunit F, partial [Gammaproteobacteria bacterium]|nr:NADH-quinone oxidoreductase subunit F [Gammaproteobacteria bacterium]
MSAATTKPHKKPGRSRGRRVDGLALREIAALIGDNPKRRELLIEYLHRIQDKYGHLSAQHLHALGHAMGLPSAEVYEVASFYHHFDIVKEHDSPPPRLTVRVCDSISCEMFGAHRLVDELARRLGKEIRVISVPCVGRCETAPVAVVGTYPVKQATAKKVINAVKNGRIQHQPEDYTGFHRYRSEGGYHTLSRYLAGQLTDEEVLTTVDDSNLRGLGGAGFPVGRKWRIVQDQPSPRLMAVNIDESEPGTFKDRYYLERDPHRFLEGMLIAAQVVGIESIYIYLRDEYAACRKLLSRELAVLKNKLGHPLPAIHLRRGAGAYVCGEESAMIESIEGKRGMPRLRPPYVAQLGLFGRPTLVHNMESLYWIPRILEQGSQWFTSQGRHGRRGLRSFSVS